MTKLFVGNLTSNRTPDELRKLFQTYGSVAGVEIMTDPETRYSRGFAFVEMTNDLEAKKAISNLNGMILWGKPIRVEDSRQLSELDLVSPLNGTPLQQRC
jgi:RNA recognition motif-containing protein